MRREEGGPASFLDALVLDLAAKGASEPDPLLNETIG